MPSTSSMTLLMPCAGRSSRYPGTRPKWMLTTPEGQLMVERAAESVSSAQVSRLVLGILQRHEDEFGGSEAIRRAFGNSVDIVVLDQDTKGPADTVRLMIERAQVTGPIAIKDADSFFTTTDLPGGSGISICDLRQHLDISRVGAKSFVLINEQNIITDIVEKEVCSNYISAGLYFFSATDIFLSCFNAISAKFEYKEIFVSHVISEAISSGEIFHPHIVSGLIDVGTLADWREYTQSRSVYFIDLDGVVFVNHSKYFSPFWDEEDQPIPENVATLLDIQKRGGQFIFATSRPEMYRAKTQSSLEKLGLRIHALVMGCQHGKRYLLNDFARSNPYPSAIAVNLPRNTPCLAEYLSLGGQ